MLSRLICETLKRLILAVDVIIFEGTNGVGKSTYVKVLAQILNAPAYRAFKRPGADHHADGELDRLRAMGIPANTFVDDMYLADMSRMIDHEIIVDRSFPSAVAYEMVEHQGTFKGDWVHYAVEWERLLSYSRRPVLLVRLHCLRSIALERMTGHVPDGKAAMELEAWLDRAMEVLDLPQMTINTGRTSIPEGIRRVKAEMEDLCQQASINSGVG